MTDKIMSSKTETKKKLAVITGASAGIGEACARLFAEKGYRLALTYNNGEDKAKNIAEELGSLTECKIYKIDFSDPVNAEKTALRMAEETNGAEVLINNAGIAHFALLQDMTLDEWTRVFNVNTTSAFIMTKAFLPYMIREQKGAVINVSSVWGMGGASCEAAYSASKAALVALTKALARETALSGVRVNCVAPGVIDTRMNGHFSAEEKRELEESVPLGRYGSPEEIAKVIYFLASDDASYITGEVICADGGMYH